MIPRTLPADRPVILQGERPHGVFLVRDGLLRLLRVESSGQMADLGLARPGSLVGLTEVVTGSRSPVTVETRRCSEMEYIPRAQFVSFLFGHSKLAIQLLIHLSTELEHLRAQVCATTTRSRSSRQRLLDLLGELVTLSDVPGNKPEVPVQVTVNELALRLGLSRQWTSGLLQDLIAEGIVRRGGRCLLLTRRVYEP